MADCLKGLLDRSFIHVGQICKGKLIVGRRWQNALLSIGLDDGSEHFMTTGEVLPSLIEPFHI